MSRLQRPVCGRPSLWAVATFGPDRCCLARNPIEPSTITGTIRLQHHLSGFLRWESRHVAPVCRLWDRDGPPPHCAHELLISLCTWRQLPWIAGSGLSAQHWGMDTPRAQGQPPHLRFGMRYPLGHMPSLRGESVVSGFGKCSSTVIDRRTSCRAAP